MNEHKSENEVDSLVATATDKIDLSLLIQENDVKIYTDTDDIYNIINLILEKNYSEEAFYIVDLGRVVKQYQKWKQNLPLVEPYYAVKCNSNMLVCKVLASLGCHFDCASKTEIANIISITKDPSRIIFANPCKMSNQIKYARANDVDLLTFDSDDELYKIKLYHPHAKLVLRIKVDDSKSRCKFNCKFGCGVEEVDKILMVAKVLKLDVHGVSFHVGSGCGDPKQYDLAIRDCRKVYDIAKSHGYTLKLLDIGGGFPGSDAETATFEAMSEVINLALEKYFGKKRSMEPTDTESQEAVTSEFDVTDEALSELRVIAEPGRFMVTTSHTLVVNVIGKKEYVDEKHQKNFIYYLNDGVYGSFNCIYFDHAIPNIHPFNERNETHYPSKIFGPTCDSIDKIAECVMLPELAIGEWCYIENFGAYTTAAASTFNGFLRPKTFYIMTT